MYESTWFFLFKEVIHAGEKKVYFDCLDISIRVRGD